jgi:hypothetical protein
MPDRVIHIFCRSIDPSTNSPRFGRRYYSYKEHLLLPHTPSMILDDWLDADVLGCFRFLDTAVNLNWVEAQRRCEDIGGYLAEPRTRRYILKTLK